jgi:hypothetical protein
MKTFIFIISGLALFNFFGLRERALTQEKYVKYIENEVHGIRTSKTIGDVRFIAQFQPYEYYLLRKSFRKKIEKKDIDELQGYYYVQLRIGPKSGRRPLIELQDNPTDYNRRLSYCMMQMQNDLILIDGPDTLPCEIFNFERNYGVAPFNNFILGFRRKTTQESALVRDKTLVFNDNLFNLGLIKLRIESKDLENIPKLKQ